MDKRFPGKSKTAKPKFETPDFKQNITSLDPSPTDQAESAP